MTITGRITTNGTRARQRNANAMTANGGTVKTTTTTTSLILPVGGKDDTIQ
jgi:hypothetical protein